MRQPDDWTEAEASELQLINRINELEILLIDLKADLLIRGEKDSQGCNVVNLSGSIWHRINKAIKHQA